jgi:hypothetical protein
LGDYNKKNPFNYSPDFSNKDPFHGYSDPRRIVNLSNIITNKHNKTNKNNSLWNFLFVLPMFLKNITAEEIDITRITIE